jgi:hypothetical protein
MGQRTLTELFGHKNKVYKMRLKHIRKAIKHKYSTKNWLKMFHQKVKGVPFEITRHVKTCYNCGFEYDLSYLEKTDNLGNYVCFDCIDGLGPEDLPVGLGTKGYSL